MKKISLTAGLLRILLSVALFVTVAAAIAGFVYAQGNLRSYAVEVSHKWVDAEASANAITVLVETESNLAAKQDVIAKADILKSSADLPQFQVVEDVLRHAHDNDLTVANFDFVASEAGATTAPASAPAAETPAAGTKKPTPAPKGVGLTVSLKSPTNYMDFLQFLNDIEHSLPKMYVQQIAMSPSDNGKAVMVEPITITMHTR